MPEMSPVAQNIIPPAPNQGLSNLSSILDVRQRMQNLQTGQYLQQTARADATQKQQQNAELQAAQTLALQGAKSGKYTNQDGSFNRQKMADDITQVAPTYGQGVSGQLLSQANEVIQNQKTHQEMSVQQQGILSNTFQSLASKDDVSRSDITDALDALTDQFKDVPGFKRMALSMAAHLPNQGNSQQLQQIMGQWAAAGRGETTQIPSIMDTGGAIQPGATGRYTSTFTPKGQPIGKGLAPQIVQPPGGGPQSLVGGIYGAGGKSPAPALGGGPQPAASDWTNFAAYNQNLNSRVELASDMLPRLKLTETAADAIRTGAGTETRASIAKSLQALNAPKGLVDAVAGGNLADVQEAEKMMFQTTMSGLRQSMSNEPARVAEFQSAEKVFPNVDTDPRARAQILGFMSDQGQRDYAEQQALNQARKNGTFNPVTWQGEYQKQLRSGAIPGVPVSQIPAGSKGGTPTAVQKQAPPGAIEKLKANPGLAPQFKAKYGYLPNG